MTLVTERVPDLGASSRMREPIRPADGAPMLDVVVPVYNEETDLEPCVRELHAYLTAQLPYPFRITIADNASVDRTPQVAARLSGELPQVRVLRLAEKGRGRALRHAWSQSDAAVLAYLDVDLSTDLAALLPLVAPLISGHSEVAIGSRLTRQSRVVRGPKREIISRCYNLLLRGALAASFSDAQCGFKAIRADVARQLLPHVRDTGWFFDTELLVLAQNAGLRIHEVPVDWVDDPDSRVDIVSTAIADLKGVARVGRALATGALPLSTLRAQLDGRPEGPVAGGGGESDARPAVRAAGRVAAIAGVSRGFVAQLARFALVGGVSTVAYLLLYALLRDPLGVQGANLTALLITAVANTAANRRLTFGIRGSVDALRHQLQGLLIFALGVALTSGALALLPVLVTAPGHAAELIVLIGANLLATLLRFTIFRSWVFARPAPATGEKA